MIKFADLFCGIGSFHLALSALGAECVFACDIDKHCRATYQKNHGFSPVGDIRDVDVTKVPKFDILCSGFPCQPFSVAGQHRGFDDERGNMFLQTMRFVEHHQPAAVILENVVGLERHDNGRTLSKIISLLNEQGYFVKRTMLTCSDHGIPQMRRRLFIVGTRQKTADTFLDFTLQSTLAPKPTLTDFLNQGRPSADHVKFTRKTIAYTIRCGGKHSPVDDGHNWDGYYVMRTDSSETVYRLTIKDCLKLQGFDENSFVMMGPESAQWKMVGNTIPTNLTKLVTGVVYSHVESCKHKKIKET